MPQATILTLRLWRRKEQSLNLADSEGFPLTGDLAGWLPHPGAEERERGRHGTGQMRATLERLQGGSVLV